MKTILTYLFCFVLLFSVIAGAEEDSLYQKMVDILERGDAAYNNKEYQKSIEAYLEATTYPEAEDEKSAIFYNISCSYSLLGEAEKALECLDSAAQGGYSNYKWLNQDSDFDFLRKNHESRFDEIIERVKAVRGKEILRKTPVDIIEYDNYNGPLGIATYDWKDLNRPEFDTLRNRYQLDKITEDGKTEFEKMTRMLNWVSTRWKHDGSIMAPERTALAILREVDNGKRFCCANYADVVIDCMRSLGFPTRFVGLRTDEAAYDMGGGHGCLEVWSNQYQKWILLDGQNNAWWEHEDIPQSAYECHRLFINGKEDELKFVGQHEQVDYARIKSVWSAYFHRVICYWMGTGYELVSDVVRPELLYQSTPQNNEITDQFDKVYPRLNQTKITLRHDRKGPLDSINVILEHTMPYFDRFLVRINEMEWKEAGDTFPWVLNDGVNIIEAKAVNAVGIEGKPSRIIIRNNLGAQN